MRYSASVRGSTLRTLQEMEEARAASIRRRAAYDQQLDGSGGRYSAIAGRRGPDRTKPKRERRY
jgi:hypothetical protein